MNQVVYVSRGGNTKKIADCIAKAINTTAQSVEKIQSVENTDILFVGASLYAGRIDKKMQTFLKGLNESQVKTVAVFSTSASGNSALNEIKKALGNSNIKVLDEEFYCNGSFLFSNKGKPDEKDFSEAEAFAHRVCKGNN